MPSRRPEPDARQERRKHPRIDKNIPLKISSGDFDIVTQTANLSCAGAYCKVDKPLEPMTKLKINLLVPLKKRNKPATRKISCEGVIVRSEKAPEDGCFNVAIFFNSINERDLRSLSEYVDSLRDGPQRGAEKTS